MNHYLEFGLIFGLLFGLILGILLTLILQINGIWIIPNKEKPKVEEVNEDDWWKNGQPPPF